jgi:hypothetical protein
MPCEKGLLLLDGGKMQLLSDWPERALFTDGLACYRMARKLLAEWKAVL